MRTPPDTYPPHRLGARGEHIAARMLERAGWTVLARGYRFGRREIDLVARRNGILAFIEVKSRAGLGWGRPEEAVTARKRREIEAVARAYLARERPRDVVFRFDVIAIEFERDVMRRCEHIEDAWRP